MLIRRLQFLTKLNYGYRFTSAIKKPRTDYYKVLGLNQSASLEQIKQAYRNLAMKFHPDVNVTDTYLNEADSEKFKEIAEAYAILSQPQSRDAYDLLNQTQKQEQVYSPRDEADQYFTDRDESGHLVRRPTQKGGYAETRRKFLAEQREKYNVDFLGRYKGGLPQKDVGNVRRSIKGSAMGSPGTVHYADIHRRKEELQIPEQRVGLDDTAQFSNYQNETKWEQTRRWSRFSASVDYDYFKFQTYSTGWRWFRNFFLIFVALPVVAESYLKFRNQRLLDAFLEFKSTHLAEVKFTHGDNQIVIDSNGVIRIATPKPSNHHAQH